MSNYISMGKSFCCSLWNLKKGVEQRIIDQSTTIRRTSSVQYSADMLKRFQQLIDWDQGSIPPTFPYALSTHLHFELVNDSHFPFSPYGLLHKTEQISVLQQLRKGNWEIHSYIEDYRNNPTGFDFDVQSDLYIEGELCWKSKTTAYKRIRSSSGKKTRQSMPLSGDEVLLIEPKMARSYGFLSNNIDPIHMSRFSAKIMGHRSSIMHGMWGLARSLRDIQFLEYPHQITCRFISPMYLPCKVRLGIEKNDDGVQFGFFPIIGDKPHFLGTVTTV